MNRTGTKQNTSGGRNGWWGTDVDLFGVFCLVVLLSLQTTACVATVLRNGDQSATSESLQATKETETQLTETYGAEVRSVIERFELQWGSLEAHTDPSIQSQVATGPYLEYFGYARLSEAIYAQPFWLITTSASVEKVRVLEYGPVRLKAIAGVVREVAEVTTGGEPKQSRGTLRICGIYVFAREDTIWKLVGFFRIIGDPEEVTSTWEDSAPWLKDIIGGLPDEHDPCGWSAEGYYQW
jgi:hypothetical protein